MLVGVSVAEYNGRALEVIRQAMQASGTDRNASGFARKLRAVAGDGPSYRTVIGWLNGATVPGWALLASAEVVGNDQVTASSNVAVSGSAELVVGRQEFEELRRIALATQDALAQLERRLLSEEAKAEVG